MAEGLIDLNPASNLDIVDLLQRATLHISFFKMPELPAFLHTLKNYQGYRQNQLGIYLLLLTSIRTGELRQVTKEQFDLPNSLRKIPVQNIKQRQKRVRNQLEEITHKNQQNQKPENTLQQATTQTKGAYKTEYQRKNIIN